MKYDCMKPEWADKEPCPLDTGELENCAECVWARERETEDCHGGPEGWGAVFIGRCSPFERVCNRKSRRRSKRRPMT